MNLDNQIICSCFNISEKEMRAKIQLEGITFEQFLESSGAGSKCTACLLDIEYAFSQTTDREIAAPSKISKPIASPFPIRKSIWDFFDKISPSIPIVLENIAPVLIGPEIKQTVLISNDSLMFEGIDCAPPTKVEYVVRNSSGVICARGEKTAYPGDIVKIIPTEYLPKLTTLAVGSIALRRKSLAPGHRGTTRPQLTIEALKGASSVHFQRSDFKIDRWVSVLWNPKSEIIFLALLNEGPWPLSYSVTYPYGVNVSGKTLHNSQIDVPPYGSHLYRLSLPEYFADSVGNKPFDVRIRCDGKSPRKVYSLFSDIALSCFSIDHL